MRYQAMLLVTLGQLNNAREKAQVSMSIAASARHPDSVAYARQILADILAREGRWREAIREYRVALKEARDIGSRRLEAAVMIGLARVQLALGEAEGARQRALEALRISNECVAVFQQIRAVILLGSSLIGLGNLDLGKELLQLAYKLATQCEYLALRREAEAAITDIDIGTVGAGPGFQPYGQDGTRTT
jgi:tetratricopeptide (TPR) repeat protein